MKRATKKLVKEILEPFTGWSFAYNFKESQRIVLHGFTSDIQIKSALLTHGIAVTDHTPRRELQSGSMKLTLAE